MTGVDRVLNLVSQVKSQSRGLRRQKRRIERLRREVSIEENRMLFCLAEWLTKAGRDHPCITGTCGHNRDQKTSECFNAVSILADWRSCIAVARRMLEAKP